jgi:hypothetical protein
MVTVLLACWASFSHAAEPWPLAITAECAQALSKGRQKECKGGLATSFSMLNWNVEKAQLAEGHWQAG